MQQQSIKISKLKNNVGQIQGLPKNPRKITSSAKDALRKSIVESPEIAEWKCLLPVNKKRHSIICDRCNTGI